MTDRTIVWYRRDLRRADHPALRLALDEADEAVAVFVLDERLWGPAGLHRRWFLVGCLGALAGDLGGGLVVRRGPPADALTALARSIGATEVICTADHGPYGRRRDAAVATALREHGVRLRRVDSPYAVAPGAVTTAAGTHSRVFTPFARAWRDHGWDAPSPAPRRPLHLLADLASDPLPEVATPSATLPEPGAAAGHRRLDEFLRGPAASYDRDRDRPDLDRTSRLSPYLKWGCLHPRQVLARLDRSRRAHRVLETEVAWREFYGHVLAEWPASARTPLRTALAGLEVDNGPDADERFRAWAEGRTGYPVVDAGMRQLRREGWVHNRVRMIAASFLVKDLHLDWRRGAAHFMEWLVDADLASNQHGWQWVAGTGTDAAPFHRVFNPVTQSRRFDPDGSYIRRHVPELADLAPPHVHAPWEQPGGPPPGYPAPVVDHDDERREALRRYAATRA